MSKSTKPAYELTDAERRDLVELIQAGKPLPEKYRFVLFEDKRKGSMKRMRLHGIAAWSTR